MDLLSIAKDVADRVEQEAASANVPVTVTIIDIHGNTILQHRMNGALAFSMLISERKAYTSALTRARTADLFDLVQPGKDLFHLLSQDKFCAMGGGAPFEHDGIIVGGVGVSGGTVSEDVAILEAALGRSKTAGPADSPGAVSDPSSAS